MRINRYVLGYQQYQPITLPNGAAPLGAALITDENDADAGNIAVYYVSDKPLTETGVTTFGAYVIQTGNELPSDVRIFPVQHVLTGGVEPPNARFLATVNDHHIFIGEPRRLLTD
jgi:hypothetical protein